MNGELSNGLAQLTTSGNRIVNAATGAVVLLRGVNRSGLEYTTPDEQGFLSGANITRPEIEAIVRGWSCNIVRVPFNQDFVLRGRNGRSGEEYQRALDQVVYWNSLFGAYTLLDLQWLDAERVYGGDRNFVAPLPNLESIELWTVLSRRYRDEPAVLYDIFTEPHDRLLDDPYALNKEDGTLYPVDRRSVTMSEWQPWAYKLAGAIRSDNPQSLVFISGINWGYDLRGMPIDIANAVYSSHVYPNKGKNWAEAFGDLSARVPVFIGEFGGGASKAELAFGRRLLGYLEKLGIGWAAWSWQDQPYLVKRYAATPFGELIRERLTEEI